VERADSLERSRAASGADAPSPPAGWPRLNDADPVEANLQAAEQASLRELLVPGCASIVLFRLGYGAYHALAPETPVSMAVAVSAFVLASVAAVVIVLDRWGRLSTGALTPVAVAMLASLCTADAVALWLRPSAVYAFFLALSVVATAVAATRTRHLAVAAGPAVLAWGARLADPGIEDRAPLGLMLTSTVLVAVVVSTARKRLLERVARLRTEEQCQRRELKRALAEAQAARRDLDAKVAERTAALERELERRRASEQERERLDEQLRQAQKMEAIGRLAGGVAHDFNNLLTVLRSSLDVLGRPGPPSDERLSALSDAVEAADRATELTRGLLAFGRKQTLARAPLDVSALVRSVVRLVQRLGRANIRIDVVDPTPGLRVMGDRTQLEQVLLNLAINACDAMPRGGVLRFAIDTADPASRDPQGRESAPGEHVRVSVSDTGVGMDEATRNAIFEPFFTTKSTGRGTGLGLAVAHGIVTQHGGVIDVRSAPGQGSTFEVWLPRTAAPERLGDSGERIRSSIPPAKRPRAETILVVEDEPGVRRATVRILRSAGYEVVAAESGAEALRVAGTCDGIDLVLSDIVMPDLDGPETVARLRATRPALRALFVSGYGEDVLSRAGGLAEGDGLLAKPFRPGQLLTAVADALQDARVDASDRAGHAPRPGRG
jgi:signal transduction histidine kinase/ActR/RegA family two-component response regulator